MNTLRADNTTEVSLLALSKSTMTCRAAEKRQRLERLRRAVMAGDYRVHEPAVAEALIPWLIPRNQTVLADGAAA